MIGKAQTPTAEQAQNLADMHFTVCRMIPKVIQKTKDRKDKVLHKIQLEKDKFHWTPQQPSYSNPYQAVTTAAGQPERSMTNEAEKYQKLQDKMTKRQVDLQLLRLFHNRETVSKMKEKIDAKHKHNDINKEKNMGKEVDSAKNLLKQAQNVEGLHKPNT